MNIKYILFDLDGTVIDSLNGIRNSFMHTFNEFNIKIPEDIIKSKFVGPPLENTFEHVGIKDVNGAVSTYRKYYVEKGIYECSIFDGIEYVLNELKKINKILIVATSKIEHLAIEVLKNNNLLQYFDFVCGSDKNLTRNTKAKVIQHAISLASIKNIDEAIMIGDTKYDIDGANEVNMKSIGVCYGYGDIKNATFKCHSAYDILDIIK